MGTQSITEAQEIYSADSLAGVSTDCNTPSDETRVTWMEILTADEEVLLKVPAMKGQ